ncbi:hypothetical protein ACHAXT_002684 [Thalassiosira profunda]
MSICGAPLVGAVDEGSAGCGRFRDQAEAAGCGKRQRTSPSGGDQHLNILAHLPELALTHAASYLPRPSRALLAVAMAAPSQSWQQYYSEGTPRTLSAAGRAVLGNGRWEELDFEEVEKELASKLTDDDVAAMLICIDAKTNLRKLKLSGCVNISGSGLEPLRQSVVLEHADLSLVGQHEKPNVRPLPMLEVGVVCDVLQSIVRLGGNNSLKLLTLPKMWSNTETPAMWREGTALRSFMGEYAEVFRNRNPPCSNCNDPLMGNGGDADTARSVSRNIAVYVERALNA